MNFPPKKYKNKREFIMVKTIVFISITTTVKFCTFSVVKIRVKHKDTSLTPTFELILAVLF